MKHVLCLVDVVVSLRSPECLNFQPKIYRLCHLRAIAAPLKRRNAFSSGNVSLTPLMTSKSMTFRFPVLLAQAIESQARATGRDRTTVVAEALIHTFGLPLPAKATATIEMLQQQIERLESNITGLSQQLVALQQGTRMDSNGRATRLHPIPEQSGSLQRADCLNPPVALLKRILAMMTDPVFVCDRQQQLIYINPVGARSLGLEEGTTLQQTIEALALPSELKAQLIIQLEAVFTSGRSMTSEISFTTLLQGLRHYEYTLSPMQGRVEQIEAVLFSTQDITERKQLESVLKSAEANYQTLFESTDDSILILDALTQRLLNANTKLSKRLGYTRQELFQLGVDAILPRWSSDLALIQSQQLQLCDTSVFQHYLRHKNGVDIPVEVHSRLIEYDDRLAILSFIRDLSQPILER
jgi:PAS domain S-box-containing protein